MMRTVVRRSLHLLTAVLGAAAFGPVVPSGASYVYDVPAEGSLHAQLASPATTTPAASTRARALRARTYPRTSPGLVRLGSGFVLATKAGSLAIDEGGAFSESELRVAQKFADEGTTCGSGFRRAKVARPTSLSTACHTMCTRLRHRT